MLTMLAAVMLFSVAAPVSAVDSDKKLDEVARESVPESEKSADEIARELVNPNNSLASLVFRNQFRTYEGTLPNADNQSNYTLLFQPVFPFTLEPTKSGGIANLFIRPAIPLLVDQPTFDTTTGSFKGVTALGDIGFDIGYGVTEKSGLLWAYGMVGSLPTATDKKVASDQWRLGPEVMFAQFYKWGVLGILPTHLWNVAGSNDKYFSTTSTQVFLVYLPGGGWNVGTKPIMSYDWVTDQATVPLNLAVGKTVKYGSTPVKLEIEVNYFVAKDDAFGQKWMIAFNITPVVPNVIDAWVKGK